MDSEPSEQAAKAPPGAAGRAARAISRHRSETYVARRSPAVLLSWLKALARRAYEARWTLRVISVTAAAAGAAWAVCMPLGHVPSAFGAASAVYAVQLTVRTSVLDGVKRTVLMVLAVFFAVVILRTVGLSALAVIALVFVSLGAGQLLRLGLSGSLQIPGTAIFILALGPSLTTAEVLDRVLATFIGAVVGAVASYLAYPGDPRTRARRALADLCRAIADLLSEMSAGVEATPSATEADLWLARSRGLEEDLEHVRPLVDEAVAFLRVDIFGRKVSSSELAEVMSALVHSVAQVRAIARTLFDHRIDGAPRLPASLAEVLSRTALAYHARAEALQGEDPNVDAALEAVRQARRESLRSLRRVDETGSWVVSGAILTEVDRMVQQLEGDAPALDVQPTRSRRRPHRPGRSGRS
ncbi:MAG: aromatic acid exporter family protein [Acidimicrobiales bacterium]